MEHCCQPDDDDVMNTRYGHTYYNMGQVLLTKMILILTALLVCSVVGHVSYLPTNKRCPDLE
eukprot:8311931-Alexandrium_andersonii.AAC.1